MRFGLVGSTENLLLATFEGSFVCFYEHFFFVRFYILERPQKIMAKKNFNGKMKI
jgi:hypothetical protein